MITRWFTFSCLFQLTSLIRYDAIKQQTGEILTPQKYIFITSNNKYDFYYSQILGFLSNLHLISN